MAMTRRAFVEQAGLATAAGLLSGCGLCRTDVSNSILESLSAPQCDPNHTFENWSHTIRFHPGRFCQPRTEKELSDVVKAALETGTRVRVQGAGHSFSPLVTTDGTLLSLDGLQGGGVTRDGQRATVPGGMRLKHAIPELRKLGLGFRNLGSITEQSIAGAFSTGTHGSGLRLGAISTQVVGLRLVDGNGDVRTITESDVQELAAARINLGALGIITQVTLECVPDYKIEYSAYLTKLDQVMPEIDRLNAENERVVLWWLVMPCLPRDTVILITKNPVGHSGGRLGEPDVDLGAKIPGRQLTRAEKTLRKAGGTPVTKRFTRIRHYVADYDDALTIPLLPVFHRECEYAIPVEKTVEALRAMRAFIDEGDLTLTLPIELRFVAADDILLSPCHGRAVCYIGASTLLNSTEVFERFEPLMKSLGGRPHWGKNFTLTQDEVARLYPTTYERFREVRDRFDPQRVFANSMLTDLLP